MAPSIVQVIIMGTYRYRMKISLIVEDSDS
jgi:hypothetical protein